MIRLSLFSQGIGDNLKPLFFISVLSFGLNSVGYTDSSRLPGLVDQSGENLPQLLKDGNEAETDVPKPVLKPASGSDVPVATLEKINFSGKIVVPVENLNEIASSYLHRQLTHQDISQLKFELTSYYYQQGYPLVRVVTPPQDLNSGTLDVVIYMGQLGALDIENHSTLSSSIAQAMLYRIKSGDVFQESVAESVVQDLNDLTNISARISLRPGEKTGTTDLRLFIDEVAQDSQLVYLNNYGSKLTGEWVLNGDFTKSNLLGFGESFNVFLKKSEDDLDLIQLSFTSPIAIKSLKVDAHWLHSKNDIGDRLAALRASGETNTFGLGLSGTLINTLKKKITFHGGIEHRRHESFLNSVPESDDQITQAFFEASLLNRLKDFVYLTNVRLSKGVSWFGADKRGEANATRITGNPKATILSASFIGRFRISDNEQLSLSARAQHSTSDLLSSDLFALGGYHSIRGFEPAETTGERGISGSLEYIHQFPMTNNWSIMASPFIDAGLVKNNVANSVSDHRLASLGIGVEFSRQWSNQSMTKLRLDWAHPIGSYTSTTVDTDTLYAQLSQTF